MTLKKLLEQLNYRDRDIDDTDAKLLWMGVKHHFRDKNNFKRMLNGIHPNDTPYVHIGDLKTVPKSIKNKHKNLVLSFHHRTDRDGGYGKTADGFHIIQLTKFQSLHPNMLQDKHFFDSHISFYKELQRKFIPFTHEYKHYSDSSSGLTVDPTDKLARTSQKDYYNNNSELRAFTHEKQYSIQRALLQNNHFPNNNKQYDDVAFTHLPLRKRLYMYRDNDFADKLHVIHSHNPELSAGVPHHDWYNMLSPDKQKEVRKTLEPIINKGMIKTDGHE